MFADALNRALFNVACHPVGQRAIKMTRLVPLANAALAAVPVRRRVSRSGVRYRLPYVDSWLLARAVFGGLEYRCEELEAAAPSITRIVDLGCNVGYFPLYLEHLRRLSGDERSALLGLAVDCNARALHYARENLGANGLGGVECIRGVASGPRSGSRRVALAASSISSSAEPDRWPSSRIGVALEDVPCLDLERLWAERYGEARVDLAKIDIEGSEVEFLRENADFMGRVDRVLLEWHKPQVHEADVAQALGVSGHWATRTLHEDERFGVLWAVRIAGPPH